MDRILVLTVDRDDDLGNKTSIRGPVVNRRNVLTAALKLGMADPEESDTNAILGALAQYDRLLESKGAEDEVEVAVLTGDEKVGQRSDRAISAQLDEVVNAFQPDRCIVVTDGAEDEAVLPLIQSRVKIEHIEKIIVKQSKGIEGTYYYIVKALEDPKWRSRFMIPAGLILAILGLGVMLPDAIGSVVLGGLPLLTGLYIFAKGAGIDDNVNRVMQEMRENADAAMFTSLLWTATLFSALFAVAEGWRQYEAADRNGRRVGVRVAGNPAQRPGVDCAGFPDLDGRIHDAAHQARQLLRTHDHPLDFRPRRLLLRGFVPDHRQRGPRRGVHVRSPEHPQRTDDAHDLDRRAVVRHGGQPQPQGTATLQHPVPRRVNGFGSIGGAGKPPLSFTVET